MIRIYRLVQFANTLLNESVCMLVKCHVTDLQVDRAQLSTVMMSCRAMDPIQIFKIRQESDLAGYLPVCLARTGIR